MTFSHLFNPGYMTPLHALAMLLLAPDAAFSMDLTSEQRSRFVANVVIWVGVARMTDQVEDIRQYFKTFLTDAFISDAEYLHGLDLAKQLVNMN